MAGLKPKIATMAQSNGSYTPGWDWRNPNNYYNFEGTEELPFPWQSGYEVGIDLEESDTCSISYGWRLVSSDVNSSPQPEVSPEVKIEYSPYFALYNIYTGTLRVFMYIGTPHFDTGQVLVLYSEIVKSDQWQNPISSSDATTAGLLLNSAGAYSVPISPANTKTNAVREYVVPGPAQSRTWIVKDYNLSYDRNLSQYKSLFFNVIVESIDKTKVTLGGKFGLKENTIFNSTVSNSTAGNVLFGALNLPKDIRMTMNKTDALGKDLNTIGGTLQKKGGILYAIGKTLSSVAAGIGGGPVGFGIGIAKFIASFTNLLGGATTRSAVTFGHGDLTISGHYISNQEKTNISFPLPQVQYPSQPRGVKFHGKVGLFSLKHEPQVTILREQFPYECRESKNYPYREYQSFGLYVQFNDQNMKDLFNVNSSHMQLESVKALPIVTIEGAFLGFTYLPYLFAIL